MTKSIKRRDLLKTAGALGATYAAGGLGVSVAAEAQGGRRRRSLRPRLLDSMPSATGQETLPVGKTKADQERNAALLSGYDYKKYATALTGYTGQDLQRIGFLRWEHAVRTRVGPRGNYKAGMTRLPNGKLVLAVCRDNNDPDRMKRKFLIFVYEASDEGLTWQEIGKTPLFGKEPSLAALPDGSLVLTAQRGYFGPGQTLDEFPVSRARDGGRTWQTQMLPGGENYPRNLIVEPDGSCWFLTGTNKPNLLQQYRSKDGGETWQFSDALIDWDNPGYGEVSAIRLKSGRYLAAFRTQIPGTTGEGFQDTHIADSSDGGKHWSKPWRMSYTAEVHAYLTELKDGRILATYSNYHLPWGSFAILSQDGGKTWDVDHPIQLSLSADFYVGWPVTLQLPDGSLITSYAATTYYKEPPDRFTCEVVRWRLP